MSGAYQTIDFQALIPGSSDPGLEVHIARGGKLDGSAEFYTAAIMRARVNTQGRRLKPEHVITIVGEEGGSLGELLEDLADLFEQTEPVTMEPGYSKKTSLGYRVGDPPEEEH
jgi:hypothetical protein